MTSTLKADILESKTTDGNLTVRGNGSGLVNLEAGFLVDGSAGVPGASIRNDAIDSQHYADGSIDTAHLADDAVTLAKVADDAIGVSQLSATGTASSSVFLRGDNAWAAAGGGAWTLIGTQVASNSASLTQTGIDSTYDTYAIAFSDIKPASDAQTVEIRFGDSGGIDSGSANYSWHCAQSHSEGSSYFAGSSNSYTRISVADAVAVGNQTGEGFGALCFLSRPSDGTTNPAIHGTNAIIDASTRISGGAFHGMRKAVISMDRIQMFFDGGNITSGRMTVWGIKHT